MPGDEYSPKFRMLAMVNVETVYCRWVDNLEAHREEAVKLVGEGRYRVWRLYMAASARMFEAGNLQVHQTLAVKAASGSSGVPLRRADIVLP